MRPAVPPSDACDTLDALADEPSHRRAGRVHRPHARPSPPASRSPTTGLSPELRSALIRNGITALWEHQADGDRRAARRPQRRASRPAPRRASRSATRCRSSSRSLDGDAGHRAARVPDQGARAGPAPLAALVARARARARRPTTATPRPTTAPGRARTPTCCSRTPRCCTSGSCRRTRSGRRSSCGCATSWSTSCTRCAACSAVHVAHVLRRLRRLCEHYGADPTFCFTSATIGNPARAGVAAVRPAGRGDRRRRRRRGPSAASRCGSDRCSTSTPARARRPTSRPAMLMSRFVEDGHQTLAFTRSRRERRARRGAGARRCSTRSMPAGQVPEIAAYRAGYLADERRELEAKLTIGRARRRRGHERARARHRRRRARRGRAQRLPRHARVDAPADRARGPRHRAGPRRCSSRATTSSTSGTCAIPSELLARPDRGRGRQPGEPVRGARAGRVRGARAAAHPRRRAVVRRVPRRRGARARASTISLQVRDGRMYWVGRRPPARRRRAAQRVVGRVPARRRGRARSSAPSTPRACSRSRTRARSTSTRGGSTG